VSIAISRAIVENRRDRPDSYAARASCGDLSADRQQHECDPSTGTAALTGKPAVESEPTAL
jgi:hypothetical protein